MNLLQETKEAIEDSGHTEADIIFIGSEKSGHQCTWDEFCVLADVEYDAGYDTPAQVAEDLIIVFGDGQRLWRGERDGAEWWNYSPKFNRPDASFPIKRLVVAGTEFVGWVNLGQINEASNEEASGDE